MTDWMIGNGEKNVKGAVGLRGWSWDLSRMVYFFRVLEVQVYFGKDCRGFDNIALSKSFKYPE